MLAIPNRDWALVSICRVDPTENVNMINVFSRNRDASDIPPDVLSALTEAAAKFSLDINGMCAIDNTNCAN